MNKVDISMKYATTFSSLKRKDEQISFLNEFREFKDSVNENNTLFDILNSNFISKNKKKELIKEIFANKIDNDLLLFLNIIIDENRFSLLNRIYDYSRKILFKNNNILLIKVYSVFNLSEEQVSKIKRIYINKYKAFDAVVEVYIEEKLIGGIKILTNGIIEDDSVEAKLKQVKKILEIDI